MSFFVVPAKRRYKKKLIKIFEQMRIPYTEKEEIHEVVIKESKLNDARAEVERFVLNKQKESFEVWDTSDRHTRKTAFAKLKGYGSLGAMIQRLGSVSEFNRIFDDYLLHNSKHELIEIIRTLR